MAKPPKSALPVWVQHPLYLAVRGFVASVQWMGLGQALRTARGVGRRLGEAKLNRKRLARAMDHLSVAFPDWSEDQRREYAVRSYEHLFMLGVETAFAPRVLTEDAWLKHISVGGIGEGVRSLLSGRPCVLICGHVGNWEVLGYSVALLGFPMHALYRPLDMKPLDAWLRRTRSQRGLTLVDKFGALRQLPELLKGGAPIGFVADQNAGDRGIFVPYFGRLTSTYKSIGLLALQFGADVVCGSARRIEPGDPLWRPGDEMKFALELADTFGPADYAAQPDPLFYLTARYRRALETIVRRSPEQYLWMHRLWRSRPRHERLGRPFPEQLVAKLQQLPWMTETELERIKEQSARDGATLARLGVDKLP